MGNLPLIGTLNIPSPPSQSKQSPFDIYTLLLVNGNLYVGKTKMGGVQKRFKQHVEGQGSEWTRLYPPVKVLNVFPGDGFDEDTQVIRMMNQYGIDKVRGGMYVQFILSQEQQLEIRRKMDSATDKCFHCGSSQHFIKNCPQWSIRQHIPQHLKEVSFEERHWTQYNQASLSTTTTTTTATTATTLSKPLLSPQPTETERKTTGRCYYCNGIGHYAKKCEKRMSESRCYKCKQMGHFAVDCGKK